MKQVKFYTYIVFKIYPHKTIFSKTHDTHFFFFAPSLHFLLATLQALSSHIWLVVLYWIAQL